MPTGKCGESAAYAGNLPREYPGWSSKGQSVDSPTFCLHRGIMPHKTNTARQLQRSISSYSTNIIEQLRRCESPVQNHRNDAVEACQNQTKTRIEDHPRPGRTNFGCQH